MHVSATMHSWSCCLTNFLDYVRAVHSVFWWIRPTLGTCCGVKSAVRVVAAVPIRLFLYMKIPGGLLFSTLAPYVLGTFWNWSLLSRSQVSATRPADIMIAILTVLQGLSNESQQRFASWARHALPNQTVLHGLLT